MDRGGVRVDIFLDGRLRLEEALEGRLAERHLLQLSLLVALPSLCLRHVEFLVLATIHGAHHGLDVKHLGAKHQIGLLERIAPLAYVFCDFLLQVRRNRMGKDAFGSVAITQRIDRHVLKLVQVLINLLVVLMGPVVVVGEFAELLNLFLSNKQTRRK